MTTTFAVGDIVTYKAQFLRDIGIHTDVPINGRVAKVKGEIVTVEFPEQTVPCHRSNLILFNERHLEPR